MAGASEPVLIWGAGAIGGTIGAFLTRAGYDVTLVDTVTAQVRISTSMCGMVRP